MLILPVTLAVPVVVANAVAMVMAPTVDELEPKNSIKPATLPPVLDTP